MKIEEKDLALEIKTAIDDLFEGEIFYSNDGLRLEFFNGQKFALKIEELK